ncbi:MAG: cysteine hydrolase [Bacilli bacterium]|nr:cysteine hydrolase [Bacilli bacterium]
MNILIVVDMQNDFLTGPLGNKECINTIPFVRNEILSQKYSKIIFTQDTHHEDYLNTQEGRNLPIKHCIEGTYGWNIEQTLLDAAQQSKIEHCCVKKPTFGSMDLLHLLGQLTPNDEITLVGVCTGICVLSNATILKANYPENKINVIAQACACVTKETHENALNAMKLIQINIIE